MGDGHKEIIGAKKSPDAAGLFDDLRLQFEAVIPNVARPPS